MTELGPFESQPDLAVAVSGGGDSMALALLLADWVRAREGSLRALIVDHGLRFDSANEAALVQSRLEQAGLNAEVLIWDGPKPEANRQAAARQARYGLMAGRCEELGLLHLALAHHREDQAETILLRLGRGSGLDGLAAMARIRKLGRLRILRPLLGVPRDRLLATLEARRLPWVEDPSNRDLRYSRVRLRNLAPQLAAEGLTAERLAKTSDHLGRARDALESQVTALLVKAVRLHPAGFAWLSVESLAAAPMEIADRALARLLTLVGGAQFTPRWDRLSRLARRLAEPNFPGATLAGCRIVRRRHGLLIAREAAAIPSQTVVPGDSLLWDGRFQVALTAEGETSDLSLGPLGAAGWREISREVPEAAAARFPPLVRPTLPALAIRGSPHCVPHLSYRRSGATVAPFMTCRFTPEVSLTSGSFRVA